MMKSWTRAIYAGLALFVVCGIVYLQLKQPPMLVKRAYVYLTQSKPPKNFCYQLNESTVVFLHFWKNQTYKALNLLETCAVRTAALRNPNSGVCMLMDSEPSYIPDTLSSLPNFQWALLDFPRLLDGSPIKNDGQTLMADTKKSQYALLDRSDLVRLLYVHKYGGKYLDTDCLTLKSLEGLRNVTGTENGQTISNGVLMFDAGNEFVTDVLRQFPKSYRPGVWASGGPALLTNMYQQKYSNLTDVVEIMEIKQFYPIHYRNASAPFLVEHYQWSARKCRNAYILHLWRNLIKDRFSSDYQIDRRSFVGRLLADNGCL